MPAILHPLLGVPHVHLSQARCLIFQLFSALYVLYRLYRTLASHLSHILPHVQAVSCPLPHVPAVLRPLYPFPHVLPHVLAVCTLLNVPAVYLMYWMPCLMLASNPGSLFQILSRSFGEKSEGEPERISHLIRWHRRHSRTLQTRETS